MRFVLSLPVKAGLLVLTAVLSAFGIAHSDCGENPNTVQAAYCAAIDAVRALPADSLEQAKAYETLAANEAHDQSTVTDLPGQQPGRPNYAGAEAWCLNNAGYIYFKIGKHDDAVRCLELCLATSGISKECKTKATKNLKAARASGGKPASASGRGSAPPEGQGAGKGL